MIENAYINIWNKRIGAIHWNSGSGFADFEYDPSFLQQQLDVAPIKMPVGTARGKIFSFPELGGSSTFKGLPGLLADVLPDRYGNALIDAWLARVGRPSGSMNPVEMLCFTGKRGMGALEFEPVVPKSAELATKVEIGSLAEVAQQILSGRQFFKTDLSHDEQKALSDILKIGTSAGGARAKAVIAYNPETGEVRSGQAHAPEGFSQWLLKFDGVDDSQFGTTSGYGRIEMAYYLMAVDCGIEMMESRLFEENGRAHFMTKRFDRLPGNEKLHVQTFCGLMHYDFNDIFSYSYEQLFQTMRMLRLTYPEAEQMYRRMVFNVIAQNCDDHTKNFAFLMNKSGEWKLAPAYDVCHAYRSGSAWVSQHALSINGKRQGITRDDLLEVGRQMNVKKAPVIVVQISEIVARWPEYAKQTNAEPELREAIGKTLLVI
ncbi:MAG: type II toxin-antitoxin system HipA family toxin [Bacteroidota bacterium]|nr:type II toxin-antitoxin system HipA family toxin [Bacteroidota bacterium]